MRRDIKSLPFFILGAVVLLGLTTCKPKTETDPSKSMPEQTLSALDVCGSGKNKILRDKAIADSSIYNAVINIIAPLTKYENIENQTVGYFPISKESIVGLIEMEQHCEILPRSDAHSWFYFALKPSLVPNKYKITVYFVCHKGKIDENKKCRQSTELMFFDLGNPDKLKPIDPDIAKLHIDKFQSYIDGSITPKFSELFYPYGFQIPWCDLLAVGENVGVHEDNRVHCVLVIKQNPHYGKDGDERKFMVSMLIRTFKQKKSTREVAEEGDDDEYYDFVNPCPNSCIP